MAPPLPKVNLSEPGWTVRQGQAVWHPGRGAQEIAGELLVAARRDGPAFVQFTKTPFPLVEAQTTVNRWTVEFPPQDKRYSGRGAPPARLLWFELARVLAGLPLPKNWVWKNSETGWRLENSSTGEFLQGYFTQ